MTELRVRSGSVVDHLLVNVGVVGPAAGGEQVQNTFHRLIRKDGAHGWDLQLGDEVTGMLAYERAWSSVIAGDIGGRRFDFTPRAGAAVGNVLTYADAGAVLRYGRDLPSDLPATHISLGPARDGYRGAATFGWYTWAGVDARAVAQNIFIDGEGSHSGTGVHRRLLGFDVDAGVALAWPNARIGFTYVRRSREFSEQDKPDRFGQLTIALAY
jgi:hypothetical protein